jgi:predicted helicase
MAEYNEIRILDLGGDVRANPKLSGTKHNVFGIQTGVALTFFIRKQGVKGCRIFYARRPELETADDKLRYLGSVKMPQIPMLELTPDKDGTWLNQTDNDFSSFIPIASKETKVGKKAGGPRAVFSVYAGGIKTNRDAWVYDFDQANLRKKVAYFYSRLGKVVKMIKASAKTGDPVAYDSTIKWSGDLKTKIARASSNLTVANGVIGVSMFRPFVKQSYWIDKTLSDRLTAHHFRMFGVNLESKNPTIAFLCVYSTNPLAALAVDGPFDYCLLKMGNGGTESCPLWMFNEGGEKVSNITDWAHKQFRARYKNRAAPV